jgi:hypothetical protein
MVESAWIKHVKAYAKKHHTTFGYAMKAAKASYKNKPKQRGKGIDWVAATKNALGGLKHPGMFRKVIYGSGNERFARPAGTFAEYKMQVKGPEKLKGF